MTPAATGFAVKGDKGIDVRTVSPTKRAAMVNCLVLNGCMVFNHFTDDHIVALWDSLMGDVGWEIIPVLIVEDLS